MVIRSVQVSRLGEGTRFEARGRAERAVRPEFTVRFDFNLPLEMPEAAGDPWLAALLLPALFAEEDLEIHAPVSQRLTRSVAEIQQILHCW